MEKIKMQPTRPKDALLTDAFADFLEKCRAKNLSEKTLNIYTVHFKFFREYLSDPDKKASDITEDTLEGFILYLQNRGCNDITVQSYMRGVRCFCYYLMEEGYLQRFKIKLPKADKRIKETYTDTELKKLLKKPNVKTCEFNEYKTWVFSNYLLATGNRISTVLSLQIKDLDFENETIQLNKCKNRKAQIVPMASSLKVILKEYLTYRKGSPDDYVWLMPIQPRPTAETVRSLSKVRYFMLKFLLICKNTFQPCGVIVHPAAIRAKAVGPAIQHDASRGNPRWRKLRFPNCCRGLLRGWCRRPKGRQQVLPREAVQSIFSS